MYIEELKMWECGDVA